MKQIPLLNNYVIISGLLLILCTISCNTQPNTASSHSRKMGELQHITLLFSNQPLNYSLQVIQDSARNAHETEIMVIQLLNLIQTQPPQIQFETLNKVDSTFGEKDKALHGYVSIFKGQAYIASGKIDTAITLTQQSLALAQTLNDSALISSAMQGLGSCYTRKSNFPLALSYLYQAIEYNPKDEIANSANLMMELSGVHTMLRNHHKAKEYAFKSVQLMESIKDSASVSRYSIYLSGTYSDLKQGDSALWAAQKAYSIAKATQDSSQFAHIYWAIGVAYMLKNDYQNALEYSNKALILSQKQQNLRLEAKINTNIANCYLVMGESEKAKKLYLSTLAEQTQKLGVKANMRICDSLVVVNLQQTGDVFLLHYFRKTRHFIDSLFSAERINIIEDVNVRYQTAEKELKIKELAYEKRGLQIQALITTLVLGVVLFASLWIMYRNRQKRAFLIQENALLEAKHNLHVQEIESHKAQLQDFIEHIRNKNDLIEKMETNMKDIIENASCISKEDYARNKIVLSEMKILTENDWKTYMAHFEKVHPEFKTQLNTLFPDLTQSETRLIVLIYLGLVRNEIANVLGISTEGVRKSQYRLRKKLNIAENIDLDKYIQSLQL